MSAFGGKADIDFRDAVHPHTVYRKFRVHVVRDASTTMN
jgi:hypothetical protein